MSLLLLAAVYYFFFTKTAKADKPYVDLPAGPAYSEFYTAVTQNINPAPGTYIGNYNYEELTRGYLKKEGLAMSAKNVKDFAAEIKAYCSSPGALPHWKL